MKRAVIIGKFHPLHHGHSHLVQSALADNHETHVLICDNPNYTLSAELRAMWVRKLHPEVLVSIIPDIGKDDDSVAWAKHTTEFLGFTPDIVYTSEAYGQPWADAMGCAHHLVDLPRNTVPVSATKIRGDISKYWNFMAPVVRSHFTRRIVVLGAESTGTTTLSNALAKHLACPWTVELGRYYSVSLEYAAHQWQHDDFVAIAKQQQNYEDRLAGISQGIVICDTNAFATMLWQERYMGNSTKEVETMARNAPADLYILTGDEIPFVQDGYRDGERIRHAMHDRFRVELSKQNVPYIEARGSVEDRTLTALRAIDELPTRKLDLYKDA